MQTFLPYSDFAKTASVLDYRRLGKQRVEAKQILMANLGMTAAWSNHPASKMWKFHSLSLALYGVYICTEWIRRGYKDNQLDWFNNILKNKNINSSTELPPWLGDEQFHKSHRSNLLRKNFNYYSQYGWTEPIDLPYKWPV